jgi:hypothetical protein
MKRRTASLFCLLFAGALCLGAAIQTEQPKTNDKKQWNQTNAKAAFNMVLTRSAYDRVFRDRLTASPDSAKQAVSDEGQVAVPNDVVILFHEDKYNENYHIFDLPQFDVNARTTHAYKQYFECCYPVW